MLIGKGPRQASDSLVDLLLECHQRIRSFCGLACRIGERSDYGSDEVAEACLGVIRYFTQALPLHVQDEEQSILPRLIGKQPQVDEALAILRSQHVSHQRPLERLVILCRELAQPSTASAELGLELRSLASGLERELSEHLELEESLVFPAIPAYLSAGVQAEVVHELRTRRQLTPMPSPKL